MTGSEGALLHFRLLQRLHIGEQYNHAFRHPHVFRQHVLQSHDTIRSIPVGDTDRSGLNGLKIPSPIVTAGQFETICLPSTVSLQDKPDMIETWGLRQLVVMMQV